MNYPPGVSGNEYPIAGPDSEEEVIRTCPDEACGYSGYVTLLTFRHETWWECPRCGDLVTEEQERGPDPDEAYDAWREWREEPDDRD
jgi:hypothetical protein